MRFFMFSVVLSVVGLLGAQSAAAADISYDFTAIGTGGGTADATGATVTGTFGFDDTVPDIETHPGFGQFFWCRVPHRRHFRRAARRLHCFVERHYSRNRYL